MPCYRAKTNHVSTAITRPGVGASWTNHWALVPCCSPSASSNSSPSGSKSSSSSVAGSKTSSSSVSGGQSSSSSAGRDPSDSSKSSTSSTSGGSSYSSSSGAAFNQYIHYRAYPCTGNNWTSVDCATWTTSALGSGVPIGVYYTDDAAVTKYTCNLNGGGQITYSILRVYGITALGQGDCALIIKDQAVTPTQYTTLLGTGYTNCTTCDNNLTAIPPSSSLSFN